MTSTHSGPYKSRLFNFIAKQYRKVTDTFDRALNEVKYATSIAAQIILYPIYVAIQTSRLGLKQARDQGQKLLPQKSEFVQKKREETSELKGVLGDGPVRKILDAATELVNNGPVPNEGVKKKETAEISARSRNKYIRSRFWEVKTRRAANHRGVKSNSKTAPYRVIVGIACSLENGNLVLVTAGNQVLDVLSKARQRQLNRRILLETLRYQRDRRFREQLEQKTEPGKLTPSTQLAYQKKGPSKLWWQMLAWMETSAIAVKANLFDESALSIVDEAESANEGQNSSPLLVYQSNKDLQRLGQEWGNYAGMPKYEPLIGLTQSSLLMFLDEAISALEKGEIAQALETTAKAARPKPQKLLPKSKVPQEGLWQTFLNQYFYPMAPLFGLGGLVPYQEEELDLQQLGSGKLSSKGKEGTRAENSAMAALKKQPKGNFGGQPQGSQLSETASLWASVSLSVPTNQATIASSSKANLDLESNSQEKEEGDRLEYKPDFLETDSVSVGYVKHPLELLLEWLDLAMLRLEESILQISQWLHDRLFHSRD